MSILSRRIQLHLPTHLPVQSCLAHTVKVNAIASTIQAANDAIEKVINNDFHGQQKRGNNGFYTDKEWAPLVIMLFNMAKQQLSSIFSAKHPWSTVNNWKKEIINTTESHRKETNEIITTDENPIRKKRRRVGQ